MKKLTLAAAVAAAALTLAGCGGGDTKTDTSTSTSAAASTGSATGQASASSTATASGSATATGTESSEAGGGGSASSLTDAKVGDEVDAAVVAQSLTEAFKDGSSGHMVMDMGSGVKAEGDFAVVGGKQNSTMTMDMGGQKMEMISVDGVTYIKSPLFGGGTKWVTMDPATGGAPDVGAYTPDKIAKAFGNQKAKVTAKDGDTTTVEMDLDLKQMMDALGGSESLGSATGNLPDSIPVTYTIDGEGRPVKTVMEMGTKMTVTYSDWGKSVSIEAPPKSEVTTM
ncbi:MAG: hypothetical protein V9G19_12510 [Tetrasphaera sp.]